ncbi:hypothetical protein SB749_04430 [Brevibacterium sp. SIMBA_078]
MLLTESSSPKGRFDRETYLFWRRPVEILITDTWTTGAPSRRTRTHPSPI